jgi:CYTH domain-containing protein
MTELSLMRTTRCFLLAPSLARLIEKERGGHQVTEGYFADQLRGNTHVRLEEGIGSLVLVRHGSGERVEEPTDLPRSQTEALLDLTSGGITYRRIPLSLGPSRAQVLRFTAPGSLDLISVEFERDDHARDFQPLPWFGPEATTEPSYQNRSLALAGLPETRKVELTDAALASLLDTLENRVVAWHPPQQRTWLKQRAAS